MHSKIFQISSKPIDKDEYCKPEDFYDNSGDFADYIGDQVTNADDRKDYIGYLASMIKCVFTHEGDGVFVYNGEESLREFKQQWVDELKALVGKLTVDNLLKEYSLYHIQQTAEQTHLNSGYRMKIEEWNGWAGPMADLFEWTESRLKEGDRIYVGAIIDYHY